MDLGHRTAPHARAGTTAWRALLRRWPSALGLGVATLLLATGAAERDTLAITVTAAAVCYLAAAALGRPWVAWASIAGASLVLVVGELAGLPWWVGLALTGLALVVVGLWRGAPRPTLVQAAALLGFGALAVVALIVEPRAGLVLAGLTLAGHAFWDAIHHRRDQVVSRSLAEACMLLDVPLGLGCIGLGLAA
ncbi:hypothetical protein GB883_17010 [Georgenia thermotolerans]|uniref:Uncharacterized protein n=2 Tax=Georgenia thermotolerans TaxID=527326 RepID=A0A7J5UKI6_9MICO|nr:hypothetical protein GB883_17010 [Georgenia thermotolerans]